MKRIGRLFAAMAAVVLTASVASCDKKSGNEKSDKLDTATREELASLAAKDSRLTGELENKTIKWMANWGFSSEKDPNLVVFQERYGGQIEETIIDWAVRYDKLATAINGDEGIDFFPAGDTDAFPKGAIKSMFVPVDDYIDFDSELNALKVRYGRLCAYSAVVTVGGPSHYIICLSLIIEDISSLIISPGIDLESFFESAGLACFLAVFINMQSTR
jgi:ABC-type glycerol-3-phosphate transport system substrate-binding protein